MLKFWELAVSPNSIKVFMALRFKGIEFDVIPVDPLDRQPLVSASGQELAPIIADRGIVLNDSEAILQYLDANYTDSPRLFPPDRAGRKECVAWKATLDQKIISTWFTVFRYCLGWIDDLDETARSGFAGFLGWLESELGERDSFKGADKPVCDLLVAEWAAFALPGTGLIRRVPLFDRFKSVFGVHETDYPRLVRFLGPWNRRLA